MFNVTETFLVVVLQKQEIKIHKKIKCDNRAINKTFLKNVIQQIPVKSFMLINVFFNAHLALARQTSPNMEKKKEQWTKEKEGEDREEERDGGREREATVAFEWFSAS